MSENDIEALAQAILSEEVDSTDLDEISRLCGISAIKGINPQLVYTLPEILDRVIDQPEEEPET